MGGPGSGVNVGTQVGGRNRMGSIKSSLGTRVPNAPVPVGRSQSAEVRWPAITPRDISVLRPPSAHERNHTTLHFLFASFGLNVRLIYCIIVLV